MASQGFEAFMEKLQAANARVDVMRAEVGELRKKIDKEHEEVSAELVAKRRSGELGKDWQVLQQRIDMRRTTERDIYSGVDKSPEARRIRELMVRNMRTVKRAMDKARDDEHSDLGEAVRRMDEVRRSTGR